MVSVCTVPARGGRSCEHFGGYKTINRIPLPLYIRQSNTLDILEYNLEYFTTHINLFKVRTHSLSISIKYTGYIGIQ